MYPVKNTKAAQWLLDALEKPWGRSPSANYVAAVIPRGFAAYARLLHPAYGEGDGREVTWAEVAKHTGKKPHAQMQWGSIIKSSSSQPLIDLREPEMGRLPERQASMLVDILSKHTSTPGECYFALWEGWGDTALAALRQHTAPLQLYDRSYYLLRGNISEMANGLLPNISLPASIWWPADRSWCVATEIDLMWTYIGGAEDCIKEILSDSRLEAWPTTLDHRVDVHGDNINVEV